MIISWDLFLDIWPSGKALKYLLQNMYLVLHLLYHKCNPLIRIADGSILFKYLRLFFKKKNWDSLHTRLNSHNEAWSYKVKKHKKIRAHSRLQQLKNKGAQQLHVSSRNIEAIDVWKVTHHPPSRFVVMCDYYSF